MQTSDLALLLYMLNRWAEAHQAHFRTIAESTGTDESFAVACFLANQVEEYRDQAERVSVRDFVGNLQMAYWERN